MCENQVTKKYSETNGKVKLGIQVNVNEYIVKIVNFVFICSSLTSFVLIRSHLYSCPYLLSFLLSFFERAFCSLSSFFTSISKLLLNLLDASSSIASFVFIWSRLHSLCPHLVPFVLMSLFALISPQLL